QGRRRSCCLDRRRRHERQQRSRPDRLRRGAHGEVERAPDGRKQIHAVRTAMQFIASLWAWCEASSLHATIALWVLYALGSLFNALVRWLTSRNWAAIAERHPRWAGFF